MALSAIPLFAQNPPVPLAQSALRTQVIVPNASVTGTTVHKLAKLTGAPSTAVISVTTDTGGVIGIVTAGAGTAGSATIQTSGFVSCVFDGATTAGDYVQISISVNGDCADGGSILPSSGQVLGRVLSTNGSGGAYQMDLTGSGGAAGPAGATGTFGPETAAHTVNYTASISAYPAGDCNSTIAMNGSSLTLTLPLPGACGAIDVINLNASTTLALASSGGALINGTTTPTVTLAATTTPSSGSYSGWRITATPDGLGWHVWSANGPTGATGATGPTGPTNRTLSFLFTNNGSALTTGIIPLVATAPAACTITAWDIAVSPNAVGTNTFKFLKVAHGTSNPAAGDSINTSGLSIASGANTNVSTTLTDFTTTAIAQYDFLSVNATAVDGTITSATVSLICQ